MSRSLNLLNTQDVISILVGELDYDDTSSASTEIQMELDDEDSDDELEYRTTLHDERRLCISDMVSFIKSPCSVNYEKILQIPDNLFRKYFHLNRETAMHLVDIVSNNDRLRSTTFDSHASALYSFLIAFHYFSTGEYDFVFEAEHMNCHSFAQLNQPQHVVKNVIVHVALLMAKHYERFPRNARIQQRLVRGFEEKFNIKNTLGCIDCLHVSIVEPTREKYKYVNRRKYESLNVETICDSNLLFTSVRIYPGWNRDAHGFFKCRLRENLHQLLAMKSYDVDTIQWLLADEAYPVDTFLLPPYENPQVDYEYAFNDLHSHVFDATVKRALELVRTTFKCLLKHKRIDFEPVVASFIVRACFVLYNILMKHGDIDFDMDVYEVDDMEECYTHFKKNIRKNCPLGEKARNTYAKTLIRTHKKPQHCHQ